MRMHHLRIRERSARHARRALVATCVGAGSLAYASAVSAQALDATPPLPNVLLLVDTSGSMELMMDGCNTDTGLYPDGTGGGNCNGTIPSVSTNPYCDGVSARSPNRWATEVAALTGSYLNSTGSGTAYSCLSMPRAPGSAFANEFSYQYAPGVSVSPYDLNYYLNYHRPVENLSATTACAFGFVQGPTGWNASDTSGAGVTHSENPVSPGQPDFAAAAIGGYEYNVTTMAPVSPLAPTACPAGLGQAENGLINFGLNSIRFGLMTIDSDTLPNTGVNVGSDNGNLTFSDVPNGGVASNVSTGMWSYYNGWETPGAGPTFTGATTGRPAGCAETGVTKIPFEVGARNPAAPPWEGRMIRFPPAGATSPAGNNTNIMQAIRVMRPYGANPIAGMMDDAKYYFWTDPQGPSSPATDPLGACRQQYIILFSHAAPNEDLQPYCQGTANGSVGMCPYDYPEYIASGLATGNYSQGSGVVNAQSATASGTPVKTFVVGFSLESSLGDGGEFASCKQILLGVAPTQTVNTSSAFCGSPGTSGPDSGTPGNPVYASCCALARIAVNGGTQVPYFADNSTDLNTALQNILAIIVSNTTTRATPVLLPQSASSASGGGAVPALFVSSFSPSSATSWSGNVQRERYACPEPSQASGLPPYLPVSTTNGDDFAYNLNNSGSQTRNVIMVEPALDSSSTRNAATTIRPWVQGTKTPTAFDGYSMYDGVEYGYSYTTTSNTVASLAASFTGTPTITTGITSDVLFPGGCTYKQPGMTFNDADCELIALGWLLGMQSHPADWKTTIAPFPSRYYTGVGSVPPSSSPLGGVYHSTPAIATPPSALLRDDSYQSFSQYYTSNYAQYVGAAEPRHTVLYVATTDGLMHAFGVDFRAKPDGSNGDAYTFIGSTHATEGGTSQTQNELWSFVPPALMPLLMNSVGGGESVLLDGAPVVKDTVFQRSAIGTGEDWHTSLVAGFGSTMGGYYALDVTDPSFANRGTAPNSFSPASHTNGNSKTPPLFSSGQGYMGPENGAAKGGTPPGGAMPMGPHFLWQLIDSSLFASASGTPAITTVSINDPDVSGNPLTEVGVAILPGGAGTPYNSACPRVSCPTGLGSCAAGGAKISDASPSGYPLGSYVRQWTKSGCPSMALTGPQNPAQGRSLTVVRLDTGEVLRTFAVLSDLPANHPLYGTAASFTQQPEVITGTPPANPAAKYAYKGRVTQADFDSPISGTPVPYPSDVGAIAQRVFVGDQDGTIWRLDVSNPDTNNWFVEPLIDAYNGNTALQTKAGASSDATFALQRAPVVLAPTVSIGRDGNVVLNFGTGDTNFIGTATNPNFVYSITELPSSSAGRLLANLDWYLQLPSFGEMMTGPASVFDGGYYFATFRPASGSACGSGAAYIWGMDFTVPADATGKPSTTIVNNGGVYKMTDSGGASAPSVPGGPAIIPGVTITSTLACASATVSSDPATGGSTISMSSSTPPYYEISALQGTPAGSAGAGGGTVGGSAVGQVNIAVSVHSQTLVDSWASIVE